LYLKFHAVISNWTFRLLAYRLAPEIIDWLVSYSVDKISPYKNFCLAHTPESHCLLLGFNSSRMLNNCHIPYSRASHPKLQIQDLIWSTVQIHFISNTISVKVTCTRGQIWRAWPQLICCAPFLSICS
jgi:hypothetical protein